MRGIFNKKLKEEKGINIEEIEATSYDNGYDDGKSEGKDEMQIEIAKRLKKANLKDEDIAEITDINPSELKDVN